MIETGSRIYLPPVTDLKAIAAGIFEEDDTGVQVFIGMPFNMLGISLDSDCIPPIHTMDTVRQNPTRQSLATPVSLSVDKCALSEDVSKYILPFAFST